MPGLGFLKLQKNPLRSIPTGGIFISSPRVNLIDEKGHIFPPTGVNLHRLFHRVKPPMSTPGSGWNTYCSRYHSGRRTACHWMTSCRQHMPPATMPDRGTFLIRNNQKSLHSKKSDNTTPRAGETSPALTLFYATTPQHVLLRWLTLK